MTSPHTTPARNNQNPNRNAAETVQMYLMSASPPPAFSFLPGKE